MRISMDFQTFLRHAAEAGAVVRITVLSEGESGVTFIARWTDRDGSDVDYRCEGDVLLTRVRAPGETMDNAN